MENKPFLLYIETATEMCSVALSRGNQIIGVKESNDGNSHSKNLIIFMDELLSQCQVKRQDLDGVVVSIGPGSYTGLRIGVSTAKGIAYALSIPVITVMTLENIAQGARAWWLKTKNTVNPQIVPMIDARRMEVFTTRYDFDIESLESVTSVIVDEQTYSALCKDQPILFCGNGMPKCKEILSQYGNAYFCEQPISAQYMLPVALKKWQGKDFVDVAYFEPFYLKEYIAGKPSVKGLH